MFQVVPVCGIPTVRLEGTAADWEALCARVSAFDEYGLEWWTESLKPVCQKLADTANGKVDQKWWQGIYKLSNGCDGRELSGWIGHLVPYIKLKKGLAAEHRNPLVTGERTVILHEQLPSSLATLPFTWVNPQTGHTKGMELRAGFVAVKQDADLGLRPHIGWAVRALEPIEQVTERLSAYECRPALPLQKLQGLAGRYASIGRMPAVFQGFYGRCNGGAFGGTAKHPVYRLRGLEEVEVLPIQVPAEDKHARWKEEPTACAVFCDLPMGKSCGLILGKGYSYQGDIVLLNSKRESQQVFPVVARSFDKFLEAMFDSPGAPYCTVSGFQPELAAEFRVVN